MNSMRPRRVAALTAVSVAVVGLLAVRAVASVGGCGQRGHAGRNASAVRTSLATKTTRATTPLRGAAYDALVLKGKPVAYWRMAGRIRERDLTGNGHGGIYKGGRPGTALMPNGDRAADFNGTTEYLRVPSSAAFSIRTTKRLTWEGWIRPDVLQFPTGSKGYVDWLGKCANYAPTCEWEARIYNSNNPQGRCSRLSAYAFNPTAGLGSGAYWQGACGLMQPGRWLFVVGEYQIVSTPSGCSSTYPGTIDVWVNGIKWDMKAHLPTGCMSQYKVSPKSGNSPLTVGTMARDYWFQGGIGKVAVYNRLLSSAEISRHYSSMTGVRRAGRCSSVCTFG